MKRSGSLGEDDRSLSAPSGPSGVAPPHLVLVGLPGAGKSTVGRLLAQRLGCPFVDFDEEIARRSGRTVAEIFTEHGEAAFRRLEADLTEELAAAPSMVMAPGGGWMAQAGNMERLAGRARTVYLRVAPETALARLRGSTTVRPLLAGPDASVVLGQLKEEREHFYIRADAQVDTELVDPQQVTLLLLALATRWGWPVG